MSKYIFNICDGYCICLIANELLRVSKKKINQHKNGYRQYIEEETTNKHEKRLNNANDSRNAQ